MNQVEKARLDELIEHLYTKNMGKETVETIHGIKLSEIVWYLKALQWRVRDEYINAH